MVVNINGQAFAGPCLADLPDECWLLWSNDGGWVMARAGLAYLMAFSRAEAEEAAKHQLEAYGIECTVVPVL